jgi:hypothetical protein
MNGVQDAQFVSLGKAVSLTLNNSQSLSRPGAHPFILVVGMHRSGTSLCANMLAAMGVDMADEAGILRGNERGHWERWDVVDLQDRLLEIFDRSYWSGKHLLPLPADWMADVRIKPIINEIIRLVEGLIARRHLVGIKDPRTIRFMPIWRQIFTSLQIEPIYIYCVRRPASVAISLKTRDGFDERYGESLWMEYNYDCLRYLNRKKAILIIYEDWLINPEVNISKLRNLTYQTADDVDTSDLRQLIDINMNRSGNLRSASLPLYDLVYNNIIHSFDGNIASYTEELTQILNYQAVVRQMNRGFEFAIDHTVERVARPLEARAEGLSAQLHEERSQRESLQHEREELARALETQRVATQDLEERQAAIEQELHAERGQREGLQHEREELARALETQRLATQDLEERLAAVDAVLTASIQAAEVSGSELKLTIQKCTSLSEELDRIQNQSLIKTISSCMRRRAK